MSALLPIIMSQPQMSYQMAELVTERQRKLAKGRQQNGAAMFYTDRTDHFFRVDQVLRQHNTMVEEQAMSGMRVLMW